MVTVKFVLHNSESKCGCICTSIHSDQECSFEVNIPMVPTWSHFNSLHGSVSLTGSGLGSFWMRLNQEMANGV